MRFHSVITVPINFDRVYFLHYMIGLLEVGMTRLNGKEEYRRSFVGVGLIIPLTLLILSLRLVCGLVD